MSEFDWARKFPHMTPVKSSPALFRINGCGVGLYGRRDQDAETGTYVGTWCLCLIFVPVLCLRAFRVAAAPSGGWYFIGREPLSAMAKGWNVLLLAGLAALIGGQQYHAYTTTPAYLAKKQMVSAGAMVEKGELAKAAKVYQTLAIADTGQGANAVEAMRGLLAGPCDGAPLNESAGVYAAAAQLARRVNKPTPAQVAAGGLKLANARGDADPAGGLAILDAVRPLVLDTREVDAKRLALLRKRAAAAPNDLGIVVPLASLLESANEFAEAKKLLLPHRAALGDGEGARVLGMILSREGDLNGAYALLWPHVKARLDRLHAAEADLERTVDRLNDEQLALLNADKGPADFYASYKAATPDGQKTLVTEYVNARIRNDATYLAAQEAMEREAAVVPVALELGMVMLGRAQDQADPAERKTQLESAEKVFLAVGGVAGETDVYRVSLGEVYYWLGKHDEGRKLFDGYLADKGRAAESLLAIAAKLRMVGAVPDARTLAEEAYGKGSKSEERFGAAQLRALCRIDQDDEILWLRRSDGSNPSVKASLAKAEGDAALRAGRDDEAVRQFRVAIDAYAAQPRSTTTLNETALAHYSIFLATGNAESFALCRDLIQQAVDLRPGDAVLLYNAGTMLLDGALAEVIGSAIDLRALRESADVGTFGYLYRDEAGRQALAAKVKAHPGVARALSYLDKVTVLSPKNGHAFSTLYGVHRFLRDEAALRSLAQRVTAAGLDTSDDATASKEFRDGTKDKQFIEQLATARKRAEELAATLKPRGGPTAAYALAAQASLILSADAYTSAEDLEKVVALVEEAHRLAPSSRIDGMRQTALMIRAAHSLAKADPGFAAFRKRHRRAAGDSYLMAAIAAEPGPFQRAVLAHPDVQAAMSICRDTAKRRPEATSAADWAMLKTSFPAEAEAVASHIRAQPRNAVDQTISSTLRPASPSEALDAYWLSQILGRPADGQAELKRVADLGVPVPVPPKP